MRPFRSHATRWPISVLCILSVCLTLCTTIVLTPSSARAQVASITQVAVIDFRNSSSMPGQMFGRMATDAVVLELIRSGKFGVIPSDTLDATMKQLGYDANMNQSAMIRLGQEAEATSVVSGEVLSIKIDKNKKKAEARIAVKLLDVASGEVVNGAVASGISQPRIGYTADDDKMLVEAVKDAARNAVETMVSYIIAEATVLNTVGTKEVLLNKGAQDGLQPGMEMIVLRRTDGGQEEVVGRIRITRTSDSDAVGTVLKAPRGIRSEDRVRAVYQMPDYSASGQVVAAKRPSRQNLNKGKNLLWSLIALVALGTFMGGGGSKSDSVSNAVAMAGVSPDVTTRWTDGGILLAWNRPKHILNDDVLEYHVWMDNFGNAHVGDDAINVGPVLAPDRDTAPPISLPNGSFDHSTIIDTSVWSPLSYRYADTEHALADGSVETMEGITVGRTHTFWISALYRRMNASTGEYTYWETGPMAAGRATLLERPVCVSPDQTMDLPLTGITFEWEPSEGADLYRLEVSTTMDFERSKTWCKDIRKIAAPYSVTLTNELATAPELSGVQAGQSLYWRIGARKSTDNPGPVPAGTGKSTSPSGPKNTRFIYCDGWSEFTIDLPPGGDPGDGGSGGGDDDGGGPPPLPNI